MVGWLKQAAVALDDAEVEEMAQVMDDYRAVLVGQFGGDIGVDVAGREQQAGFLKRFPAGRDPPGQPSVVDLEDRRGVTVT